MGNFIFCAVRASISLLEQKRQNNLEFALEIWALLTKFSYKHFDSLKFMK